MDNNSSTKRPFYCPSADSSLPHCPQWPSGPYNEACCSFCAHGVLERAWCSSSSEPGARWSAAVVTSWTSLPGGSNCGCAPTEANCTAWHLENGRAYNQKCCHLQAKAGCHAGRREPTWAKMTHYNSWFYRRNRADNATWNRRYRKPLETWFLTIVAADCFHDKIVSHLGIPAWPYAKSIINHV